MVKLGYVINLDSRQDRMRNFQKNEFPFPVQRFSAYKAGCGEDGCTLSHLQIIKNQNEFPFAVFEDDCVLVKSWDYVEKALQQLPKDWDALWLGANLKYPLHRYSENLFRLRKAYALHAVIYNSKRMIDFIVNHHNTPSGKNLDIFYKNVVQDKFKCFIVYPMVATQSNDFSNIALSETNNQSELLHNYKKYTR